MNFSDWLERWAPYMPTQALDELNAIHRPHDVKRENGAEGSENANASDIVLYSSKVFGAPLWRNNCGADTVVDPKRPNDPPRHIRYGLGNTSTKINRAWKSADYIGIRPLMITTAMVGLCIGQFVAAETKRTGWHLTRGDKHGQAQNNFLTAVQRFGGCASFVQSVDDLRNMYNGPLKPWV